MGGLWQITKPNAAVVLFGQMPFACDLVQSQRKFFRYEWIWEKPLATGHLNANKIPLKAHENILVFYRALPTYNPQFTQGEPYCQRHMRYSDNYLIYNNGAKHVTVSSDGRRYPRDVQKFKVVMGGDCTVIWHPTQKPTDLLEYLIRTYTNEGETVLDATMRSGSTGVAAINTGRKFIGFETETKFYDIAKKRIDEAIAKKAQSLF